eukprot:jgi/Tetstr1/426377/TSEL_016689.t1
MRLSSTAAESGERAAGGSSTVWGPVDDPPSTPIDPTPGPAAGTPASASRLTVSFSGDKRELSPSGRGAPTASASGARATLSTIASPRDDCDEAADPGEAERPKSVFRQLSSHASAFVASARKAATKLPLRVARLTSLNRLKHRVSRTASGRALGPGQSGHDNGRRLADGTVSKRARRSSILMAHRDVVGAGVQEGDVTALERVDQRRADRVVRERFKGVPDHLKALISKAELDILQDLFERSDSDGSGLIGVEELPAMLRVLGLNPLEFTVKELLKEFDTSSDGELDYGEFVALWYAYREERSREDVTLEVAFAFFDIDDTGDIEREEFTTAMMELGDPLTTDELDGLFEVLDPNNSGTFSRHVFLQLCGPEDITAEAAQSVIQEVY